MKHGPNDVQSLLEVLGVGAFLYERMQSLDLVNTAAFDATGVVEDVTRITLESDFIVDVVLAPLSGHPIDCLRWKQGTGERTSSVGFRTSSPPCSYGCLQRDHLITEWLLPLSNSLWERRLRQPRRDVSVSSSSLRLLVRRRGYETSEV